MPRRRSSPNAASSSSQGWPPVGRTRSPPLALLDLKLVSAASPGVEPRAPALQEELKVAIAAAEAEGLHSEAAHGLYLLAWLIFRSNDVVRASETLLAAERASRAADETTRCRQLANTARCLMEVEARCRGCLRPRRRGRDLAKKLNITFAELEWARGLLLRWQGNLAEARERVARALDLPGPGRTTGANMNA